MLNAWSQTELWVESKGCQYDAEIFNKISMMFPRSTQTDADLNTQTDQFRSKPNNADAFLLPTLISGTLLALAGILKIVVARTTFARHLIRAQPPPHTHHPTPMPLIS